MPLIFISYDSVDSEIATRLASALRTAGFRTWLYEENSLPGPSYIEQIVRAIQDSDVVAIVISQDSMKSVHVRKELFKAYESGKEMVPILRGLTHADFRQTRPDLHQALLTNVAIPVPDGGIDSILDRIIAGIRAIIRHEFDFSNVTTPEHPVTELQFGVVAAKDPWAQLESRLSGISSTT